MTTWDLSLTGITSTYVLSVLVFAVSTTITPGPNNLMLTASGVNFGFARTIPHLLGITFGFTILCSLTAMGLGSLFIEVPILHTILKWVGATYLLYLAYKIITASDVGGVEGNAKPFSFMQAAVFQFVNPKAWTMCITGISAFSLSENIQTSAVVVVIVYSLISVPCCSIWALLGVQVGRFLSNEKYLKLFNYTLGGLTAACVLIIIS